MTKFYAMKILFINSPECDYLQELLYSGLVKNFGSENVYDYPFNKRYHFPQKKYPLDLGYNPSFKILHRPFTAFNVKLFDLVIVGSCKYLAIKKYFDLLSQISVSTPVIFVDGGDRPELGGDLVRTQSPIMLADVEKLRPFDLIFKREYLQAEKYSERVIPLPFAMNMDKIPKPTGIKKYDVSFWAVESDPIRTRALELIEGHFDCRQNGTERNQKFKKYKRKGKFYLEEISSCKVVLNFRGVGWDTLRYWEVPAMQTFMVTAKPGIAIPNDFISGEHIVHCQQDLSDLVDICDYYLKHEVERERIALAGHQHLLKYHTDIARAKFVIDTVQHRLKI